MKTICCHAFGELYSLMPCSQHRPQKNINVTSEWRGTCRSYGMKKPRSMSQEIVDSNQEWVGSGISNSKCFKN